MMMENEKKEYTFLWYIENYSYCYHKIGEKLVSPIFYTDGLAGTVWNLELYPRGDEDEDEDEGHVSLFLRRSETDDGPENYSVHYEMSVLAADGSSLDPSGDPWGFSFAKGKSDGFDYFLSMDEILLERNSEYLPKDILTVCCKIWNGKGKVVHNIGQSSARTRIKVEKISFLHVVQNFSTLEKNEKKTVEMRSLSEEKHSISCSLHFTDGSCCKEKIMIEILPSNADQFLQKCDIYVLGTSGNVTKCGTADKRFDVECKNIDRLYLSLTRAEVLGKKSDYLPDDKLSLRCVCTFSNGIAFQGIEETVHEMHFALVQKANDVPEKHDCKTTEKIFNYPSVAEDIKNLYIDKSLTDVQVKTKTQSFPAHKMVLCARSPVFKRMLSSDMKEKNSSCIQLDDLGDDVVQQLLLFLYSDTVEKLEWAMASQLYYAADKYEIGRLKEVCSSFLLENLTPTNAGELLLLADTHSDANLKSMVEDFILKHEEEVYGSEEWDAFMETNSLLAGKTMQLKYKRRQ